MQKKPVSDMPKTHCRFSWHLFRNNSRQELQHDSKSLSICSFTDVKLMQFVFAVLILLAMAVNVRAATVYEAEKATVYHGVVATNHENYSGSGFVDCANEAGSYVEFTITVPSGYTATGLAIRFSNSKSRIRPADVRIGSDPAANYSFESTGNWDTWADKDISVSLAAVSASGCVFPG